MLKRLASLFVPVAAVALSFASASHANTPLRGAVADFSARLDSPGPYVMEVSSDNTIKMPSFQAVIRFHRNGPLAGDTGNVRMRTTWDPDKAAQTGQFFTTASWIRVDKTRQGIDNEVNGWAFDGKAIATLGWGLAGKTDAYAYWCGGAKKYNLAGNVQITVDGLTGPNTDGRPSPITVEVRCTNVAPAPAFTGPVPPVVPAPTGKPAPTPPPTVAPPPTAKAPAPPSPIPIPFPNAPKAK